MKGSVTASRPGDVLEPSDVLEGENLRELLVARGPLPVKEAVDHVLEACEALAGAHRLFRVHGKLAPAQLFRARDAHGLTSIKLLDLDVSSEPRALPVYSSPEQLRSWRRVDPRSDIWSLGAVLFELVTARAVWTGRTSKEVSAQIAAEPAPDLQAIEPSVPAAFATIVARCLEKQPARRFQSVTELAAALLPFGSERAKATYDRILRTAAMPSEPPRKSRDKRVLAAVTGLALALLATVAAAVATVRRTPAAPTAAARPAPSTSIQVVPLEPVEPVEPAPLAPAVSVAPAPITLPAPARTRRKPDRPRPSAPATREVPATPAPVDPMSLRR